MIVRGETRGVMREPLVSVVVINWNAASYIAACLRSVLASDYPGMEVILVDNDSDDGSVGLLQKGLTPQEFARIRLIVNERNFGAARALNQGAAAASGDYITFLATDTTIEPDCIARLVRVMERDKKIAAVSAALYMMNEPRRFDSAGEYLSQFGILMQRHAGREIDEGQFSEEEEIFSAKGTALTVRAASFREAGGYPEDYFMFLEETDLCWRLWLAGYRVVYVPQARIYHASGISINARRDRAFLVKYYGARNYVYTLIKNLGLLRCCVMAPAHCALWYCLSLALLLKGRFRESWYVFKGVSWNFIHLVRVVRARRHSQMVRRVPDRSIMPHIMRAVPFSYLFERAAGW